MFYVPPESCQIPQLGELYEKLFGQRRNGTFIEIGAYDGESFSNTSFLADLGWHGGYVEPVLQYALICAQRHQNNLVRLLNCAVGDRPGLSKISVGEAISSMATHHIEQFNQIEWARGHHQGELQEVHVVTPPQLLKLCFADNIPAIDLMVIDVEGFELPIISAWDFEQCRPRAQIIELRDLDTEFSEEIRQESVQILQTLEGAGYSIFWRDQTNAILTLSPSNSANTPLSPVQEITSQGHSLQASTLPKDTFSF